MVLVRRHFLGLALGALGVVACGQDDPDQTQPQDQPQNQDQDQEQPERSDPTFGTRTRISYADHNDGYGDLWLPEDAEAPLPVVVLIHGGFWRGNQGLELMDGLADSLTGKGVAVWNIEYRGFDDGGGYPETFEDVADAVDHLDEVEEVDTSRVVLVGHSAGGHLSAWAASRGALPDGAPGEGPAVRPLRAFSLAGVLDLAACARDDLGSGACPRLVGGGPDEVPSHYAAGSPVELVPVGLPVIAVHGTADQTVPLSQSVTYVEAATAAGDPAELVELDGVNHFELIDPDTEAWATVSDRVLTALGDT